MISHTVGVLAMVLLTNFVSAESTEREDLSITYLKTLPDESIKSLWNWCQAHKGEPVSTNEVIDVPNYVSCAEVNLDQLSRTAENTEPITCEELKAKGLLAEHGDWFPDC